MNNFLKRQPSRSGFSYPDFLLTGIPFCVGCCLRFLHPGRQSLWADEAWSVLLAQKPVATIIRNLLHDSSPPLYYLILKFWIQLFGNSEIALRSLSALFSSASLLTAGFLAWRLTKNRLITAGIITFLAFSPTQLYFAQETRTYAMASFLFLIAITCMVVEKQTPGRGWPVIPSIILLIYTHNYGWLLWGCFLAWSFFHCRKALPYNVFIAMGSLVWIPGLYAQISHDTTSWVPPPRPSHIWHTLLSFSGKAQFMKTPSPYDTIIPLTALLFAGILLLAVLSVVQGPSKSGYFLFLGLAPWVLAVLMSFRKPMLLPGRHDTIFMAPVLVLGITTLFIHFRNRRLCKERFRSACLIAMILPLIGQAVTASYFIRTFDKANDREVARAIIQTGHAQETIVVSTDVTHSSLRYYLEGTGYTVISYPLGDKGSLPMAFLINQKEHVDKVINQLVEEIQGRARARRVIVALAGTLDANRVLVERLDTLWRRENIIPLESPRPYNSVHHLHLYSLPIQEDSEDRTDGHQHP